jgi:asparagine synthase (glutamine-hydrolysing)
MCGICGKFAFSRDERVEKALVQTMLDTIKHRGPDGEGVYTSGQVGLGHRRLAIIDLNTGQQPLSNEDGTIWIVFNGEIYNYQELRQGLIAQGHHFKTQSDTEVIVHLFEQHGPECVQKLFGMFAFALWDDRKRELLLARDRVGIKPMYYRLTNSTLHFGSEVKAIFADPTVTPEIDPRIIDRFLTYFYSPGEETIWKGIRKLPAGHYMHVKGSKAEIHQYWDLHYEPTRISVEEAAEKLNVLIDDSVRGHMIADVPVGFLLSGGVDSTAMLNYAVGKTDKELSSYTLGFHAPGITDERPYARLAAAAYGSKHHEMTISADQFRDFLPKYVWHMEEPVCEPPAIAMYYVSRLAKDYVKVLISGEGGDEAFAGYANYRTTLWLERIKKLCGPLKPALAAGATFLNNTVLHDERIARYAPMIKTPFASYYYSRTSSPFRYFTLHADELYTPDFAQSVDREWSSSVTREMLQNKAPREQLNQMLYVDTKTWLTDDLLIKADKMTMANSIELRVPLLDHRILEFAASLPTNFKVRRFTTKFMAKHTLEKRVPQAILNRRKTGFPVPYASWLRNELRPWLLDILLDKQTLERGYFQREGIEKLIDRDMQTGHYPKEIFSLAVLELLHRAFVRNTGTRTDSSSAVVGLTG